MAERFDDPERIRLHATPSLPADYIASAARRLGVAAAAASVVYLSYLVLYRTVWAEAAHGIGLAAAIPGIVVSSAVATYLLSAPRPTRRVVGVGIAYEVFLCAVLAVDDSWSVSYASPSAQVSWIAVIIVLFPFLTPASPRAVLATSLACAATTPLAIALANAVGSRPWPDDAVLASLVLPPLFCAFLAWAPTTVLHRLGTAVQRARHLGNYELVERIAQGGMGEVWRAKHRLLARPAAAKVIKPEMLGARTTSSHATLIRRFEDEAQVTAGLDSVHTVELYDFGVSADGVLFYVMELLDGMDLRTLVERFGPMPSERVIHVLIQVCDSLEDAHRRGLIHRDIKPANLFLTRRGSRWDFVKVLDFGLVKRWRLDDDAKLKDSLVGLADSQLQQTEIGQIVGTPAFLAPETALGEQVVDGRADLYALGCVAYWMLTGAVVFDEPSTVAMAVAHVTKEPEPPSRRVERTIDEKLEQIVLQCLRKDRDQRPSSAVALRDLLEAIDVDEPWSRERAAAWWSTYAPDSAAQRPLQVR